MPPSLQHRGVMNNFIHAIDDQKEPPKLHQASQALQRCVTSLEEAREVLPRWADVRHLWD